MITEDQKMEIKRLKEQGFNISQIAEKMRLDWKTVKKYNDPDQNNEKRNIEVNGRQSNSQNENELVKVIFEKLIMGISPREIVAQVGHVELVEDLYKKFAQMDGETPKNFDLPDLKIALSWDVWEESFEKYFEWHQKRAIKALAGFVWVKMGSCANFVNNDVECPQIDEVKDPYKCINCCCYSPYNFQL